MGTSAAEDRSSFRSSPAKLSQYHSTPAPTFWSQLRSYSPAIFSVIFLALILTRLYHTSGDLVSQLRGESNDGKAVVSFRFDDDFESLTEERKIAYLDEIARAMGVEHVELKGFRKGSVIVDISTGQETAERVSRDSQTIGQTLGADVSVEGLYGGSSHGNGNSARHDSYRSGYRFGALYGNEGNERESNEIVLKSGDHVETDRGLFALAKVSGMVFHDTNANGIFDYGSEEGIEGIRVLFVRGLDGEIISEMNSDRNGQYHFSEKEPGDYFVSIQLSSGHLISPLPDPTVLAEYQSRASVSRSRVVKSDFEPTRGGNSTVFALHSGSRSTELNAALYKPSTISGIAWEDVRGDGVYQPERVLELEERALGSQAMADLILQTDPEHPIVATVSLIANGRFSFDNVMPGTYKLKYSLPSDFYFVRSSLEQKTFSIGSGEIRHTEVGFYRPITVSGSIFEDLNAVGYITGKENEARRHIRGSRVELIAETAETRENNKYLQEHRKSISSAVVTSTTGAFKFEGFAPGVYHLHFTPPEGYKRSVKLSPTELEKIRMEDPEALASDADQNSGLTASYLVPSGAHLKKADESDITVCMYTLATLGGYIWEDRNADGIFDDDERALPNVEVRLSNHDHSFQRSTFTNERGHYLFKNLEPGRYLNPVIIPPLNHQLSNARITFKYVDANDRRLYE